MIPVHGAVDLGGTNIKLGILHEDRLVKELELPIQNKLGLKPALEVIRKAFDDILIEGSYYLKGLGFGFPGLVDSKQGKILGSNDKYPDAHEIDLTAWARDSWGIDLHLDNDARLATLGEWKFGVGRKCSSLVLITLGTGIGTGVVVENHLLRGLHNRAGNLGGHIPLGALGIHLPEFKHSAITCSCGNTGCAEALASTWALQRDLSEISLDGYLSQFPIHTIGFKELCDGVRVNDRCSQSLLSKYVQVWGVLSVALIHSFDPEIIIFTGNVLKSQDLILPSIQSYINKNAWTLGHKVSVLVGELPKSAALWGGAYLAKNSKEVLHEFI